jgi:3-methyladenine DNA glycosylase AlkD
MSELLKQVQNELRLYSSPKKAESSIRFFKTGKGQYGEGDKFIGVTVPEIRLVVKKYWKNLSIQETLDLLHSAFHEERLCAVIILGEKFKKGTSELKDEIYRLYLKNSSYINNWDLVDSSAHIIVGPYLEERNKEVLEKLAKSELLWDRRIAMLATFHYIRKGENSTAFKIAKLLLNDKEDLMHKAVGWMLREISKKSGDNIVIDFLKANYKQLPRTTLRYAIERMPNKDKYLIGDFS